MEASVRQQRRARKIGILYDDAYGLWTEEDQASVAAEAFAHIDRDKETYSSSLSLATRS
jgi:hypothetical protein